MIGRVLIAEDDDDMRELLVQILVKDGLLVRAVADAASLRAQVQESVDAPFDLIVSDVRLPGGSGLTVLEDLRRAIHTTPIIIMTAFSDDDTRSRADALGASLLDKPFDMRVLRTLASTLSRHG